MTKILKKRPREGDVIRSTQGRDYLVERIHKNPSGHRVVFYAVVDAETRRYPNAINPPEVVGVVAKVSAAREVYGEGWRAGARAMEHAIDAGPHDVGLCSECNEITESADRYPSDA